MRPARAVQKWNRKQEQVRQAERRRYWKMTVCRAGCVMCNALKEGSTVVEKIPLIVLSARAPELRDIQGHHLLPQQALKRHHLEDHLLDERNGVGLCEYHHARHTLFVERLPRELLPPDVYDFADELGILYVLDREYPL